MINLDSLEPKLYCDLTNLKLLNLTLQSIVGRTTNVVPEVGGRADETKKSGDDAVKSREA